MPKTEIDYTNTIFYKIQCNNPVVKDVYIGHTTNFVQRKHAHKRSCTHEKSANHNCKVYNIIRQYGGWNNWKMEIIAFHECADHYAARKIEQKYFEEYKATLNSIEPLPKPKVTPPKETRIKPERKQPHCEKCNVYFSTATAHDIHNRTNKHIKMVATNIKKTTNDSSKLSAKFVCEKCDYKCCRKGDYNKHLGSVKHNTTNTTNIQQSYSCDCGKIYNHRASLYNHKKSCTYTPPSLPLPPENTITYTVEPIEPNSAELMVLVKELMKQNMELQNTMKEMIPHLGNNNNTNTTNVNGPTFNVQFFLDNDCKNAQSIQEFVKSIEFNQEHLVSMTKDGYVDTISNILIEALNKMDVTDRPLHCTDLKRETVYIKDKESWNKSTADAPLMNRVISCMEKGCVIQVKNYVDQTPESTELDTPEYQFYHKAHWNTLGAGEDASKLNKKIYKKVLPQVKLDKQPA